MMPLRAHITQGEQIGGPELALHRNFILLRIRHPVARVEYRRGSNRAEHACWDVRRRIEISRKWIGTECPRAAILVGGIKRRRNDRGVKRSIGRIADYAEVICALERAIEHSVGNANAGLVRPTKQFAQKSLRDIRRVGQSQPRSEVTPPHRSNGFWNAGIAREHPAPGRIRKFYRLLAQLERLDFIVLLPPRGDHVPPHAVIQRQIRTRAPAVLRKRSKIVAARIRRRRLSLLKSARRTQQEVGEIYPGLRGPIEEEVAVFDVVQLLGQLCVMKASAKGQAVRSHQLAEVVRCLVSILDQAQDAARDANVEALKIYLWQSFGRRVEWKNPACCRIG